MDSVDVEEGVRTALRTFWAVRSRQAKSQGAKTGIKDTGARSAVTGGKHLDGFVDLCRQLADSTRIDNLAVHFRSRREVPGYFRAEKSWDLLVMSGSDLLALIEFKAQVGPSFGNNANNRAEEALGNAVDFWTAFREGAFNVSPRPWLGFVFLLEDCDEARRPVSVSEPHFKVRPEFIGASYGQRYEQLLTKLVRERLYDAAALILTERPKTARSPIRFHSPQESLSFNRFAVGLAAHLAACQK